MSGLSSFRNVKTNHIDPLLRRVHPAYIAAAAFVAIQVGIGIVFKIAQRADGKYAFSQSSSIAISEFCKGCLSTLFFYQECRRRRKESKKLAQAQTSATTYDSDEDEELEDLQLDEKRGGDVEEAKAAKSTKINERETNDDRSSSSSAQEPTWQEQRSEKAGVETYTVDSSLSLSSFIRRVENEISLETIFGMAHLALLYAIINNSTFIIFRMADPGTISVVRSGITLITALNLLVSTGQRITQFQWISIAFQICGVVITQYHPETGSIYPLATYVLLIFQTTVSAVAGVYNQIILKSESGSLHVCNMTLYAAGTIINLTVHLLSRAINPEEPSFFEGYGSSGAVMVIISNIFIGLAITAVYKYSDALVKCFASAVSTGILLYISPIIFQIELSFLVVPGTIIIFIATYLYLVSAAPKDAPPIAWRMASLDVEDRGSMNTFRAILKQLQPSGRRRIWGISISSTLSLAVIIFLAALKAGEVPVEEVEIEELPPPPPPPVVVESPFKDTLAFVRWNSKIENRIPAVKKYEPFFKAVHISMPQYEQKPDEECFSPFDTECALHLFNNLTADNFGDGMMIYANIAQTMQKILDAEEESVESEIDGLLYYHFDLWVNPLDFHDMPRDKIWFPSATNPQYECMNNTGAVGWWGWNNGFHERALNATKHAYEHLDSERRDRIKLNEWCLGWSDIYFIPRQYFEDYIYLARIFFAHRVMHEVAIPTMINIIDQTRRKNPAFGDDIVEKLGDCWGDCCTSNPSAQDVLWHRCGHRLNYLNEGVTGVFYAHLDQKASLLGTEMTDKDLGRPEDGTVFNTSILDAILKKPMQLTATIPPNSTIDED